MCIWQREGGREVEREIEREREREKASPQPNSNLSLVFCFGGGIFTGPKGRKGVFKMVAKLILSTLLGSLEESQIAPRNTEY